MATSDSAMAMYPATDPMPAYNLWRHLAITNDGTKVTFYMDDSLNADPVMPDAFHGTGTTVYLGCDNGSPNGASFWGGIDEVRIYEGVVPAGQLPSL
jgi:hypothetical protein